LEWVKRRATINVWVKSDEGLRSAHLANLIIGLIADIEGASIFTAKNIALWPGCLITPKETPNY
jgi:hypothetical protein